MSQLFAEVAKVLELQLQHHPSNAYSGLISFRIDWLDLLAVKGTLKSLLQHHSLKASILGYQKHEVSISFQGRIKNCEAASSHFIDSVSNLMRFSFLFAKDHCEVYRLFFFFKNRCF